MKVKDRMMLGMIAGLGGNAVKTLADEVLLRKKLSQRSFRATAAGVWVNTEKEATNINGQILGALSDFGLAATGGVGITICCQKRAVTMLFPKAYFLV